MRTSREPSRRVYVGGHRTAGTALGSGTADRGRRRAAGHHARVARRARTRRAAFMAVIVAIVLVGTGVSAFAFWLATGVGSGSATTGTTAQLTLTPGTPAASLYPGGSADVAVVLSNSNPFPVTVASLVLATAQGTGGFTVDAGHSGCGATALGYTTQTNSGLGWSVPARVGGVDGSLSLSLPNAVTMDAAAADACQSATFTVYLMAGS